MLGWMDDEALARTLATGRATYWSRSRGGVLGQGRDLRPPPVGQGGPPRLRRRHGAAPGRPGGPGLPHRRPHLLRRRPAAGERDRRPSRRMPDGRRWFGPVVLARSRRRAASRAVRRQALGRARRRAPARRWSTSRGGHVAAGRPRSASSCSPAGASLLVTRGRVRRRGRRPGRAGRPSACVVDRRRRPLRRRSTRPAHATVDLGARRDRGSRHRLVLGRAASAPCSALAAAVARRALRARRGPRWAAGTTRPRPPASRRTRRHGGRRPVARHRPGARPDGPRPTTRMPPRRPRRRRPLEEPACLTTTATPRPPGRPSSVAMLGFVVGGIGLMFDPVSMPMFWVGVALGVASLVVFVVMARMGLNGPATDARDHRRPRRDARPHRGRSGSRGAGRCAVGGWPPPRSRCTCATPTSATPGASARSTR